MHKGLEAGTSKIGMTKLTVASGDKPHKFHLDQRQAYSMLALCLIASSGIITEIALTKFVASKVYHHYVYGIISTVILSLGFAGSVVYLWPSLFGNDNPASWRRVAIATAIYAITLPLSVVLFAWLPLDPYQKDLTPFLQCITLPLYFVIFAIPFFFAGLSMNHILSASPIPVRIILFCDLVAASVGAALCPILLETLGGYGTICLAAVLGIGAFCALLQTAEKLSKTKLFGLVGLFLFVVIGTISYPGWAQNRFGFDIRSSKDSSARACMQDNFKGIERTYWNAIARIDVSKTNQSHDRYFLYGLTPAKEKLQLKGRLVLVDSGAPTRQLAVSQSLKNETFLERTFWASPYAAIPTVNRELIIGGGGGVDILIAKYFSTPQIDLVELNPSTAKHLLSGGTPEERALYQSHLQSDASSRVNLFNKEGRHFCTTQPEGRYDLIQASGVDTFTAITSGALSLVENHLYTKEAVREYIRLLTPSGVLSLTQHRPDPPVTSLRMLATYLDYLDSENIDRPWERILVTGDDWWCDLMLKKAPYSEQEVMRIRDWCKRNDRSILVDPLAPGGFKLNPGEEIFDRLARADRSERRKLLESYKFDITPVTDDKPYFYGGEKWSGGTSFYFLHGSSTPLWLFCAACFAASALMLLPPIVIARRQKIPQRIDRQRIEQANDALLPAKSFSLEPAFFYYCVFFAITGFAFLLFEICVLQLFTIFVGGPLYTLSITLVAVLLGYAIGSLIAQRFPLRRRTFVIFAFAVPCLLIALYLVLPKIVHFCMPMQDIARILIALFVTTAASVVIGMPVPTAMSVVKERHSTAVAWMWGINSGFNAIGAMSFIFLTKITGISATLLIVGFLYAIANTLFTLSFGSTRAGSAGAPQK